MTHIEKAIDLIEQGNVTEGVHLLKEQLKSSDDNTKYSIALLFQEWGFVQDAATIILELQKKYPGDSQIHLLLAELYIDLDQEEKAIEMLLNIKRGDENYLSAQLLLADLYQLQGLDEVAESKLKLAREVAPNEPVILFALGEFNLSIGQANKAIPYYEAVLNTKQLEHENIHLKLAEALSLSGQFEEALPVYKEGLKKNTSLDGLFGYAMTANQLEDYSTVISALEELKDLDPQYTTLYAILAHAYKEQGAVQEALEVLEEGLKIDEHNDRLYLEAAQLAHEQGDFSKAKHYLNCVIEIDPDNVDAIRHLVSLYESDQETEKIIEVLSTTNLDDPDLTWALANAYMEEDEVEKAINSYQEAHNNFNNNSDFLKQYGEGLIQVGRRTEALALLKEALALDPTDDKLLEFIDRLEDQA